MTVPGGGERDPGERDYQGHEYFAATTLDINTDQFGTTTGYTLHFPDGSHDEYGLIATNALLDMKKVAFLSARVDAYSHSNSFIYVQTNDVVKLLCVIDADGRTNTLLYTNTVFPSQITGVQDPFGRTANFKYDSNPSSISYGMISNLTDSATNASFCHYDSMGWLTNLITPYGTNTFEYFTNAGGTDEFHGTNGSAPARVVRVVDPVGGTNLYMLCQNVGSFVPNSYDPSITPTNGMPQTLINMLDLSDLFYRDTFYWGPRQASGLPSDITTFAASDYQKARTPLASRSLLWQLYRSDPQHSTGLQSRWRKHWPDHMAWLRGGRRQFSPPKSHRQGPSRWPNILPMVATRRMGSPH